MTDGGVSDYDMPNCTWPPAAEASGITDASLGALLEGGTPGPDAPLRLQHVADVLGALRAGPMADEVAGQDAAVAEYRARIGRSAQSAHSGRRRRAVLTPPPLLRTRVGTAAAAAVVGLGGVAAAAYAGALPAAAQQAAHDTIGAPRPSPRPHASPAAGHASTPAGPDASGHPRSGLCTAYLDGKQRGRQDEKSVAFRNLEQAAGGTANVPGYCAGVPHPGVSPPQARHQDGGRQPGDRTHPTGKPPHP